MGFKDHFSGHAGLYQQMRPAYPPALFDYLIDLAPARDSVWDCATGNGQAARELAKRFSRVYATDASEAQIRNSQDIPGIEYAVALAERSALADHSVDMITVAQAYHWFDHGDFHTEARRVLRPRGVLAIWGYQTLSTSNPELDAVIEHYYCNIVGDYWSVERRLLEQSYQGIEFPFEAIETPEFSMDANWDRSRFLGYLHSWSATQACQRETGNDPVELVEEQIDFYWPKDRVMNVTWPMVFRIGRA